MDSGISTRKVARRRSQINHLGRDKKKEVHVSSAFDNQFMATTEGLLLRTSSTCGCSARQAMERPCRTLARKSSKEGHAAAMNAPITDVYKALMWGPTWPHRSMFTKDGSGIRNIQNGGETKFRRKPYFGRTTIKLHESRFEAGMKNKWGTRVRNFSNAREVDGGGSRSPLEEETLGTLCVRNKEEELPRVVVPEASNSRLF